jgi:hypothetical protein
VLDTRHASVVGWLLLLLLVLLLLLLLLDVFLIVC